MTTEAEDLMQDNEDGSVTVMFADEPPPPEPPAATSDNDDDDDDGAAASASPAAEEGEDEAERERIRERRREERHNKKQRMQEREQTHLRAIAARDGIINELRGRLDAIERRNSGFDLATVDSQLRELNNLYQQEQLVIAEAASKNDGEGVAKSTDRMMTIRDRFNQLTQTKTAMQQNQRQPRTIDPRVATNVQQWRADNSWYDAAGNEEDTRHALIVDEQLAREGWDPVTPQYYEELTERLKKRLPHRYVSGKIERGNSGTPPSPVAGASREGRSSEGKGQGQGYTLSPDRVKAMKDAGLWNDPVKRKAAIAQYREYDRNHKGA